MQLYCTDALHTENRTAFAMYVCVHGFPPSFGISFNTAASFPVVEFLFTQHLRESVNHLELVVAHWNLQDFGLFIFFILRSSFANVTITCNRYQNPLGLYA